MSQSPPFPTGTVASRPSERGYRVDATPIYTELRHTLVDPEADNWGLSAPPEFAAALTERSEPFRQRDQKEKARDSGARSAKAGGHRHRAED